MQLSFGIAAVCPTGALAARTLPEIERYGHAWAHARGIYGRPAQSMLQTVLFWSGLQPVIVICQSESSIANYSSVSVRL